MENFKRAGERLSRAKQMAGEGKGKRRTRLGRARSEGEVSAAREDLISEEFATMMQVKAAADVKGKDSGGILRGGVEVSEGQHSRKTCAEETSRRLNLMKSTVVPRLARGARSQTETRRKSSRREQPERGGADLWMQRVLTTPNDAFLGLRVVHIQGKGRGVVVSFKFYLC